MTLIDFSFFQKYLIQNINYKFLMRLAFEVSVALRRPLTQIQILRQKKYYNNNYLAYWFSSIFSHGSAFYPKWYRERKKTPETCRKFIRLNRCFILSLEIFKACK